MTLRLQGQGYRVNRKRIVRLMRKMGLEGQSPGPSTSKPFTELWERSPCEQYRGEARKAFLALFPVGISQRETERRLWTVRRRFDIFEKEAEKLVGKGKEGYSGPQIENHVEC